MAQIGVGKVEHECVDDCQAAKNLWEAPVEGVVVGQEIGIVRWVDTSPGPSGKGRDSQLMALVSELAPWLWRRRDCTSGRTMVEGEPYGMDRPCSNLTRQVEHTQQDMDEEEGLGK